jgi:hypothetical protein
MDAEFSHIWTNAELKAINQKINDARKRGAISEMDRLTEEHRKAIKEIRNAAIEKERSTPRFDPELVDLHGKFEDSSYYTNLTARTDVVQQISTKLGRAEDNSPSAYAGFSKRNGLLFQIMWTSMSDPSTGLPSLTTWLCDNHCIGIRYEFFGSFDPDETGD